MARYVGISLKSVQRIWADHQLKPQRIRTFKLSRDPDLAGKLRDVVSLYVDPPQRAMVLSVDEKGQIQALDRTQPGLPFKPGKAGTMTHDYIRHGATTLFAALNVFGRHGHRALQTPPAPTGVHLFSEHARPKNTGGKGRPRRPGLWIGAGLRSLKTRGDPVFRAPIGLLDPRRPTASAYAHGGRFGAARALAGVVGRGAGRRRSAGPGAERTTTAQSQPIPHP